MRSRFLIFSFAAAILALWPVRPVCQECLRYNFKIPSNVIVTNLAVAAQLLGWTGGTSEECEQLRRKVEALLHHREAAAAAAETDANERWTNVIRTQPANVQVASAARERWNEAVARHAATQSAVRAFPTTCDCVQKPVNQSQPAETSQKTTREGKTTAETEDRGSSTSPIRDGAKPLPDKKPAQPRIENPKKETVRGDDELKTAEPKQAEGETQKVQPKVQRPRDSMDPRAASPSGNNSGTSRTSESVDARRNVGQEALKEIVNPFGNSSESGTTSRSASATSKPTTELVDPFSAQRPYRERAQQTAVKILQDIRDVTNTLNSSGFYEVDLTLPSGSKFASRDFIAQYRIGEGSFSSRANGPAIAPTDDSVKRELQAVSTFSSLLNEAAIHSEELAAERETAAQARAGILRVLAATRLFSVPGTSGEAAEQIYQSIVRITNQGKIRIDMNQLIRRYNAQQERGALQPGR